MIRFNGIVNKKWHASGVNPTGSKLNRADRILHVFKRQLLKKNPSHGGAKKTLVLFLKMIEGLRM
jgi:hypothetical protein